MMPPGNYLKGMPHEPHVTVAGHFTGMNYIPAGFPCRPEHVWYRGDDYQRMAHELRDVTNERNNAQRNLEDLMAACKRMSAATERLEKAVEAMVAEARAIPTVLDATKP
jgi:hypothetical protein